MVQKKQNDTIGHIVFDPSLEFLVVQIRDDMYDVPTTVVECSKYNEIIMVIKTFMDTFGKKMDCWEEMVSIDGINYYCIMTDLDDLNIDDKDDYDIISIRDFENVECSPRLKWLAYMALDKNMRKIQTFRQGFALSNRIGSAGLSSSSEDSSGSSCGSSSSSSSPNPTSSSEAL